MGLIRIIFWVVLFLASTFAFTVLFEHGPSNFAANAQTDWAALMKMYQGSTSGKPATPKP